MKNLLLLATLLPSFAQEPITRIACGSCYKPERDNGIWKTITALKPQAFLFMGDNIYADTTDPKVMEEKYRRLNLQPDYRALAKTVPIFPIWDDHDYGQNDAGAEYPMKETSARLFFDAFNFAPDHPARKTPGVYHSQIIGPEGKRVQVIMLDTRTFRSSLEKVKEGRRKVYVPATGPEATMLGEAQWEWFAEELQKPAQLRLIVSSVQVLATSHRFEKWSNMPEERQKFLALLGQHQDVPTLLLSGDRHLAELCKLPATESPFTSDLYEMTSSGLTHAGAPDDPDRLRVPGTYTRKVNFGLIEIDWAQPKPTLTLTIKDLEGASQSSTKITFE